MGIRKKNSGKNKKLPEDNIIDLEAKKEKRRQELRAAAEQSRKKHGRKSFKQTMMDEAAADELYSDRIPYPSSYRIGSISDAGAASTAIDRKAARTHRKKGMSAYMKILIAVALVVFFTLLMSIGQIVSLKLQESEAEARVKLLREQKEKLEAGTAEIGTDANIEKQARSWLKMAKQGETLYIIGDERGGKVSDSKETEKPEG